MVQMRTAAAAGAFAVTLAVTLATPYVPLPVGTATANGTSMGHDGLQVLVYADAPLVTPSPGDAVIFRTDGEYIHHRIVGVTDAGYVTKGDALTRTDQAMGRPYVTRERLVGVVLFRAPVAAVARAAAWVVLAGAAVHIVEP